MGKPFRCPVKLEVIVESKKYLLSILFVSLRFILVLYYTVWLLQAATTTDSTPYGSDEHRRGPSNAYLPHQSLSIVRAHLRSLVSRVFVALITIGAICLERSVSFLHGNGAYWRGKWVLWWGRSCLDADNNAHPWCTHTRFSSNNSRIIKLCFAL